MPWRCLKMIPSSATCCRSATDTSWSTNFRIPTSRNSNLLELLCAEPRNIVVVGDNDQAIYRFRGASFGSFKMFLERFAGWRQGQDSSPFRVTLTENYRSTPNILRVAQQVIAQNEVSADFPNKILSPNKSEGQRIRIAELAERRRSEATWVAGELERLHKRGPPLARSRHPLSPAQPSRSSRQRISRRRKIPLFWSSRASADPRSSIRARRARLPSSHQQIVRRHRLRPRPRCSGVASRTRRSRPPRRTFAQKAHLDPRCSPIAAIRSAVRPFAQSARRASRIRRLPAKIAKAPKRR